MCCKDNLKKLLSFVLAFLLGLVAATILQNEKIASKNQEIVKTNTKTIWREQGTGFSGNGGSGNSGRSNRKTTLPPFFSPKVSENSSSEIKLKIISKPKPYYTDLARQNNVQGIIRLRVTFLTNGQIGSVSPVAELPDGLTEQAIAAAKQIKFEPMIKNGQATSVVKLVEYNFTLY